MTTWNKTKNDFTTEELSKLKKTNYKYYETVIDNSRKYFVEGGVLKDENENYKVIGITNERLQNVIKDLQSPNFSHTRTRNYGITIYHKDSDSPTGVKAVNGIENDFYWLIDTMCNTSPLSPTEGLRH